jgi:hypothetical protein
LASDLDFRTGDTPPFEVCRLLRLRYQMSATPTTTTTPPTTPPTIAPMFGLDPEETLVIVWSSVGLVLCEVEDTDTL